MLQRLINIFSTICFTTAVLKILIHETKGEKETWTYNYKNAVPIFFKGNNRIRDTGLFYLSSCKMIKNLYNNLQTMLVVVVARWHNANDRLHSTKLLLQTYCIFLFWGFLCIDFLIFCRPCVLTGNFSTPKPKLKQSFLQWSNRCYSIPEPGPLLAKAETGLGSRFHYDVI